MNGLHDVPASSETHTLIIGGGPTGLLAAILLANYGIRSTVVERHFERLGQPKAHAINPRSLEILKQAGLKTNFLRSIGMSAEDGDKVRFAVSMTGIEFGNMAYERQTKETEAITPEPLFNVPQPELESFLYEHATKLELIMIWKGVQFEDCIDSRGEIQTSSLRDRKTRRSIQIKSKYILICDGANSQSRAKFQVPFSTLPGHCDTALHHVSIHFNADIRKYKSGTLWFFIGPDQQGTLICYNRTNSSVYVTNIDPEITPRQTFNEGYCRQLIDSAIGEEIPYDILSITHWTTLPKAADVFRSQKNPAAFLLGDAAHAFPPTGGLGVNTGLADAHNLVWKIHAMEQQWATQDFLDSYGHERRQVAIANAKQSAKNQAKLRQLMQLTSNPSLCKVDEVMSNLEYRKQILSAIDDNADHFDSINLQIGYIYGDEGSLQGSCDQHTPRCVPGARLPHAWIQMGKVRCSTLDLVDGTSFVILAAAKSIEWLPSSLYISGAAIPVKVWRVGQDFDDSNGTWAALMDLSTSDSGVLIRPDQHIVGRVTSVEGIGSLLKRLFAT